MSSRSITVASASSGLPRGVEAVVGNLLELVIHSIELLRERVAKPLAR